MIHHSISLPILINECASLYSNDPKTYDEFYAAMERDNFMSAQEALEFGLIDEIIAKRP
mgnify:CR=1 FL=1